MTVDHPPSTSRNKHCGPFLLMAEPQAQICYRKGAEEILLCFANQSWRCSHWWPILMKSPGRPPHALNQQHKTISPGIWLLFPSSSVVPSSALSEVEISPSSPYVPPHRLEDCHHRTPLLDPRTAPVTCFPVTWRDLLYNMLGNLGFSCTYKHPHLTVP